MAILAAGIMIAFAACGAAIGNAILFSKYLEGITRQPEARTTLFGQSMLLLAFVEAIPIMAVAFGLLLLFKVIGT